MANAIEQTHQEIRREAGPFRRFVIRGLVGVTFAVILCLAGVIVLFSRGPKSGLTMAFVSKISIPATHTLLSETDYATVHNGTLYVAYGSADQLLAIDTRTESVRTFASAMTGVHGVAFSDDSETAFASLGGKDIIAAIQVGHPSSWIAIPAGRDPDGIVFDHHAQVAYAGDNGGTTATLVPAADPTHPFSIPLGGSPEFPQVDEDTGLIYQPLEDTSEIVVVNPYTRRIVSRLPLGPCKNPHGSAIDQERKVLFVGCFNRLLAVMDMTTGAVIDTVPIGSYVDVVAWDTGLHHVYTANSAGSMTVVEESSPRTYRPIETIQTAAGGHTLAVDPQSHKVYVVCSRLRGAQILVFQPTLQAEGVRNRTESTTIFPVAHSEGVRVSLWVAQVLLFGALIIGGIMKLTMPVAKLSKMFSWTGQVSKPFLRFIGVVDLAGGMGILLPAFTHILPQLTVFAAVGCTVLQVLAIGFHARREEFRDTPFNFIMLSLSSFVLWGWW